MSTDESAPKVVSRDELIAMVAGALGNATYAEASLAGKTLAAGSKLPKLVAENLGAGFGQWEFFPEAAEIVDFAQSYVPPATAEDVWALARSWASDDAAGRRTLLALVGREILQHELRRVDVPELRAFFDEKRASRALELRASLGLEVPAAKTAKATKTPRADTTTRKPNAPAAGQPTAATATKPDVPARMPKPAFVRPPKAAPPPEAPRFRHPKFGEGVLESREGTGPDAKVTIKFESGSKTLLARFVTEVT
jgi:hypothetical protein